MLARADDAPLGYLAGLALASLVLALLAALYWFGDSGVRDQYQLQAIYDAQQQKLQVQQQLNQRLASEVAGYKNTDSRILFEQRARMDLGLIRPGDTLVQIQRDEINSAQPVYE